MRRASWGDELLPGIRDEAWACLAWGGISGGWARAELGAAAGAADCVTAAPGVGGDGCRTFGARGPRASNTTAIGHVALVAASRRRIIVLSRIPSLQEPVLTCASSPLYCALPVRRTRERD